jgi:tetratricopeptide (TPR) repeat protein
MRLLYFDTSGRLILTDFRVKLIPPYAILSHRWSDSEALIEDISNENYKEKEEGYRKLQFCAEQAAQDGLQYFWIDTCCIDRWDNNERSKAINSMFQWYRDAARCYVFLSDVSLSAVTETETAQQSDWEASFFASTWFTRGWTLQELIAPVSVEFFSREGQRIGDKALLGQLLHSITGIPLAALGNCPLDQFSTSERMQWAEKRTTTEEEDIVYCLLGLLSISMPVTYGEGKESAQKRLQAEIEATDSAPSIVPFSRNELFVGRKSQLAIIEAALFSDDQTTTTIAIVGQGGTGKSQLALEAAYRTKQNNEACSIFWMDASNLHSLHQSYASVAQKLSIPGWDDDQTDKKQVVKRCTTELSTRQCLLIFDNAEGTILRSSSSSMAQTADLNDFLPQSKLCSVILTTTESVAAEALAPQKVVVLHELSPDIALKMLQNRLTTPLSVVEQQDAMHLLKKLSYLPLAIVHAAAYMNTSGVTVQRYQAQLGEDNDAPLIYIGHPSKSKSQKPGLSNNVAVTLSLSMSRIRQSNPIAAEYLCFAACVDCKDIPLDLLEAASLQSREDAIKVLDRYALITRRPAESAFDVHRLVHYALQNSLQVQGQFQAWIRGTITQLLRVFPDHDHSNRSKWRRLLPHARYVLVKSQMDDANKERLDFAWKCAMALHSDGQYKDAEELFVEIMHTRKRVLGYEHPDTLISIGNLASTYRSQGRWKEAAGMQIQVMQIWNRVLGDKHPITLTSMANLASTYSDQGLWKEAEELQVQVMRKRRKVLGDGHSETLTSMNDLAMTYWYQGRWNEAEILLVEVMQRRRLLADKHIEMLICMGNLALTYNKQGRLKEAEELQVQVMQGRKRVLGDEHPDTLTSMNCLASTYSNQWRWKEAENLEMQLMQMRRKVLGDDHPSTLTSMNNLALTYGDQGRWKEAEDLQEQVTQKRRRVLGDEHPETLGSMCNLAKAYWDQGQWLKAEPLLVQTMLTQFRTLGDKHPSTLISMGNLAFMYNNQKRWQEAEELQARVMQVMRQVLGQRHPDTLLSMGNLLSTYMKQGKWREAEELQLQMV